jgi:Anti-sigma-K factor rskA/Putative zinc-finger
MSGCPTHGDLVGGYVLGALDPAEAEEMRRHLATCPRCAREERELAGLPALLDRVTPGPAPPALRPAVETEALRRHARALEGKGRAAHRRRRMVVSAAAAAAVAATFAVALLLPGGGDGAYAHARLAPPGPDAGAVASAELSEVPAGTGVSLRARGLRTGRDRVYELWCVRKDHRWISGGTFRARGDGSASAQLTAAVKPGDYHLLVVTRQRAGAERGRPVLRGRLKY